MADDAIIQGYELAKAELQRIRQPTKCSEKKALTFNFLQKHAIMLMAHTFAFNRNKNVLKLFWLTDHVMADIMDDQVAERLFTKERQSWDINTNNCIACYALMLSCTVNRSTVVPVAGSQKEKVFSATVVWVAADQVRISVPEAITHLQAMAKEGHNGTALCYIPSPIKTILSLSRQWPTYYGTRTGY